MLTNPKIERKKTEIARTEAKIAEIKAKLREQKQELTALEDEEIVAQYRKEILTEDALPLLRQQRGNHNSAVEQAREEKEEKPDALTEN